MKVRPEMIIKGSLVMHTRSGVKGVVIDTDIRMADRAVGNQRLVSFSDGSKSWVNVCDLEWTDSEVIKPVGKRVTISKVIFNQKVNDLLQRWCELSAANGGSFSIEQEWSTNQWWTTYTIEWPDGIVIPEGAAA